MTQVDKEKLLNKYPLPVTIDETEVILKQMKYSICKIENKNGKGTGFFCKILNNKLLITNNHVINKEIINDNNLIKVKLNDNKIKKDIKIKNYYMSIEYDTTIIEISDSDENINYLEIDDDILDDENIYNENIYIIQYPKYGNEQKGAVSYGILNELENKYNITYYCSTDHGSSGSPILKLSNKKIIGIHKEAVSKYNYNRGTLLKYPINEYLKKFNKFKNNKIKLELKIEKDDINKDIYFLDNTDGYYGDDNNIKCLYHDNLKELNELNTEIYINNKKFKYNKSFKPEKEGIYEIIIQLNIKIKDCSYMFYSCFNLINIDLSSFDTKNVTNMFCMFYGCINLINIDLYSFNTKNANNMSNMFGNCSKLKNLDLSSFNTKNVIDMSGMFNDCSNLANINLSSFDTKNVTKMFCMFQGCSNLKSINLSSFDTKNVVDMYSMFNGCSNITNIDLSSFDTKNVMNMLCMFNECSKLTSINLSSFNTKNVTNMFCMFNGCHNLVSIDLSSFDTKNVNNMSGMFHGCSSIENLNLSSFDTKNVTNINGMFHACTKLNIIKINYISLNIIKELSDTNINIIDQFGNYISKNNYINNIDNNINNSCNNNNINNMVNNNMIDNDNMMNNNMVINNNNMNNNMMINNKLYNMNKNMNNNMMNNMNNINKMNNNIIN